MPVFTRMCALMERKSSPAVGAEKKANSDIVTYDSFIWKKKVNTLGLKAERQKDETKKLFIFILYKYYLYSNKKVIYIYKSYL